MVQAYLVFFLSVLFVSTFVVLSSWQWIMMWVGLELNLLAFIPLLMGNKDVKSVEASLKYFLVQASSSMMVLLGVVIMSVSHSNWWMLLVISSLLVKLGLPPCHMWFLSIMGDLHWGKIMLLSTWQKVGPLVLLLLMFDYLLVGVACFAVVVGGLTGLGQVDLRVIMGCSSVAHMGWVVACSQVSLSLSFMYFLVYVFMFLGVVMVSRYLGIYSLRSIGYGYGLSYVLFVLLFFIIGGLPPMLGFLMKLYGLWMMIGLVSKMVIMLLIFSSVLSLLFYVLVLTPISVNYIKWVGGSSVYSSVLFMVALMLVPSYVFMMVIGVYV